ncbi:hypothetical protein ACFLEY_26655 [Bradyrhizobium sp. YCK136]|uniref:hypothetical protein n=1 Tax=Bradyrhizobium TaxID=374 RepID=UPI001B8C81AC|nr:hypothetical protein [Bradyrhizobium diazoefficiens]MBR0861201.1 hypothetical protein [Bradyrhizobium diazoefficiens]MBR0890297.1 hypothetical protein [Bradyrhizobium diazoefficiens]MBR0922071.1 hypothetical protein [Bradyrhizobium diazoefficiens]
MAKRSKSLVTKFEPIAGLERPVSARQAAERDLIFAEWNKRLADRLPYNKRLLRDYCEYLLGRPQLIEGRYAPIIFLILQLWLAKNPRGKQEHTAEQIADLVDWVIETEKIEQATKAYQSVAQTFRMTAEAVKKAHEKFGKLKPGKSSREKLR